MRILIAFVLFLTLCLGSTGCSSFQNIVQRTELNLKNQSAQVDCYSGGQKIYSGASIGKVTNDPDSDGFFFKDKDGFIEVNADCIFRYGDATNNTEK